MKIMKIRILYILMIASLLGISCQSKKTKESPIAKENVQQKRPNILWLVTEDMGAYIPPFGDSTVVTPNLSKLAAQGVVYPNLYSTSGVCAPSRAAIATGMYPSSIGANHMRVNSYTEVTGLPKYEAVPPPEVKMISELLRENGYYCTNNYKTDYQFRAPATAWDESSPYAHWRNKKKEQPFFAVFNFTETHESGLFEPYGFREIETRHYHAGDRNFEWKNKGASHAKNRMTEAETPIHLPKDTKFNIPPYLPDTPAVQRDMWKLYNNIAEMDRQVGAVLEQLKTDGELENTIIFFYGDHGGPLPREKRLIYDSGLNTPMIIRFPKQLHAGTVDKRMISFVDFAPTLLSLIGETPKAYSQGSAFLGKYKADAREFIHAAADRFDAERDVIRAVRDNRFKYIRNYKPEKGYYLPITYRERIPAMQELLKLKAKGQLTEAQMQWFRTHKPKEELFDCEADPYELNNLAALPEYKATLERLSAEMDRWLQAIDDDPNLTEKDLVSRLWAESTVQPVTADPVVINKKGEITLDCPTKGASLGYKIVPQEGKVPASWNVYTAAFQMPENSKLQVKAHRIGYKASKVVHAIHNK